MATDKRFVAKNGLDNNDQTITNVATPVNEDDVAIKSYVDTEDANAVKLTGNQTVAGAKTFSGVTTISNSSVPQLVINRTSSNNSAIKISNTLNSVFIGLGSSDGELRVGATNNLLADGHTVWHTGNDGSGSGLDADLLDGLQSTDFLLYDADATTLTGTFAATNSFVSSAITSNNIDHLWHDDLENVWHFCSDVGFKTTGNSKLRAGYLFLNGGSTSAPSLSYGSDVDTGIYFPAADNIGFVEGGTEIIRIANTGFVGIGTTSPSTKLHNVGDFTNTISGVSDFLVKRLSLSGNTYVRRVILLHARYTDTLLTNNFCVGTFFFTRGHTSSSNRKDSIYVETGSAYNNNLYYIDGLGTSARLFNCTYNSINYVALEVPYQAAQHSAIIFVGQHKSSVADSFTVIDYYNEQTATVLNSEVNSSLVEVSYRNRYFKGGLSLRDDGFILFGPNSTWEKNLRIGGNGYGGDSTTASLATTNGNLHIDAADISSGTGSTIYLNYYGGGGGVSFGSGSTSTVAFMGPDGDLWKGSADNTGSPYWHAGNDGPGSGLDADLLDGYDSSLEVVGGTSTIPIRTSSGLMYIYKIVAPNNDLLLRGGGDQVGNALLNLENSGSIQITSSTLLNSDVVISAPVGRVIIDGVTVGYGGNSSPTDSVGIGVNALLNNTGNNNVAVGQNAALANTSGWDITAVGQSALTSNTTGTMNTAVGRNALCTNSIGTSNVAVGRRALYSSTASYNVAVGADASHAGTTGTNNSAVGYRALYSATSGASNVAVGSDALYSNVTGAENVAIGYKTLYSSTAGQSVAVGAYSQYTATTGTTNSSLGYFSLYFLTTGTNNVAVGSQAARSTTTGINNTALGTSALYSNTQGNNNVAIGTSAAYAGQLVSGIVAIGRDALKDNTGSLNTAVGYNSQRLNTTGTANTSLGHQTLDENTTGAYNVALGWIALGSNTTGSHNISIGGGAGSTITTGNYNITIGRDANVSSASGEEQIVIGRGTGKGDYTAYVGGSNGAYNQKNVTTWETTSDARIKKNIVDNTQGLEVIEALAVRNFEYRTPEEIEELPSSTAIPQEGVQLGVIAQELQEILPECVTENSTGVLSVNTDPLIWYLVNAVKDLSQQVKTMQAQLEELS